MPRIALLTDFGWRDPYVAVMKGVLASRCNATVVDLTHDITPFDVFEGAWFLRTAAPWWPAETIFVSIVDPGVGSDRKILACERDGRIFLAPDNGLLTFVCREVGPFVAVENDLLFLPDGSSTFHGRDRFAPVAAALANGMSLQQLGSPVTAIARIEYSPPIYTGEGALGTVVSIDRFGNGITDLEPVHLIPGSFILRVRGAEIGRMVRTYAEGSSEPFLIVGSTGCVEISVRNGSAAGLLRLKRGDRVEIRRETP